MQNLQSLDEKIKALKEEWIQKRKALNNKTGGLELRPLRKQLKRLQRRRRVLRGWKKPAAGGQNEKPKATGGEATKAD